jgi:hypothetical protein
MVVLMIWGLQSPLKVPVRLLLLRLLRPLLWLRLHANFLASLFLLFLRRREPHL